MQAAVITLKQHFGNAGCAAKVAINLEGWMGVEQVVVGATTTFIGPDRG